MSVKPPSGVQPPVTTPTSGSQQTQAPQKAAPGQSTQASSNIIDPQAVSKALERYKKIRQRLRQPFLAGAAGLFDDATVFPQDLLDTKDPINDPKYLHLMCAVFGLKEMERYFASPEQQEEDEKDDAEEKEEKKDSEEGEE